MNIRALAAVWHQYANSMKIRALATVRRISRRRSLSPWGVEGIAPTTWGRFKFLLSLECCAFLGRTASPLGVSEGIAPTTLVRFNFLLPFGCGNCSAVGRLPYGCMEVKVPPQIVRFNF